MDLLRGVACAFGAAAAVMLYEGWTISTLPMSTVGYTYLALFYLSLILLAVVFPSGRWASIMRLAPLRSLGRIAYCVYLLHEMAYNVCGYWLTGRTDQKQLSWSTAAAGLVLSLSLAQLSWRYFESRMIRIGRRLSDDALPETPAVPIQSA